MKKITINEVWKDHFAILGWLLGSWLVALVLAYIAKDARFAGLGPVFNYLGYAIKLELDKKGFREALK